MTPAQRRNATSLSVALPPHQQPAATSAVADEMHAIRTNQAVAHVREEEAAQSEWLGQYGVDTTEGPAADTLPDVDGLLGRMGYQDMEM